MSFVILHHSPVNFMRVAGKEPPFWLQLLDRGLQPLQGVFNILVYASPHVKTMQQLNPGLSWFRAFLRVVRSGGDDDQSSKERRRRRRRKQSTRTSSSSSRHGSFASIRLRKKKNMSDMTSGPQTGTLDSTYPVRHTKGAPARRMQSLVKKSNRGDLNLYEFDEEYLETIKKNENNHTMDNVEVDMLSDEDDDVEHKQKKVSFKYDRSVDRPQSLLASNSHEEE